jgi:hypothetical protein
MVAMPYILVDIVLAIFSAIFVGATSAALVSGCLLAKLGLSAQLSNRRLLAVGVHGLGLLAISIVAVLVMPRFRHVSIGSVLMTDLFFFMGLMNSATLAYGFMDKRYFLNTPRLQRRLVIGILSVVMAVVPAMAVVAAVVGLFIIK